MFSHVCYFLFVFLIGHFLLARESGEKITIINALFMNKLIEFMLDRYQDLCWIYDCCYHCYYLFQVILKCFVKKKEREKNNKFLCLFLWLSSFSRHHVPHFKLQAIFTHNFIFSLQEKKKKVSQRRESVCTACFLLKTKCGDYFSLSGQIVANQLEMTKLRCRSHKNLVSIRPLKILSIVYCNMGQKKNKISGRSFF